MKSILIVTSCDEEWGGSEELWARSIPHLQQRGCRITVLKHRIDRNHPRFRSLAEAGVRLLEIESLLRKSARYVRRMANRAIEDFARRKPDRRAPRPEQSYLAKLFNRLKPDLVLVAQSVNFDGLHFARACFSAGLPYAVLCQKAVEFHWPVPADRTFMIEALHNARKCFFVSHHNRRLTEEQFGLRLPRAEIVFNPVTVPVEPIPYPDTSSGHRLACIGRFYVLDKGQDLLLRVMSLPKWRERSITVSFIGTGMDEEGLRSMAQLLDLKNVEFMGPVENMQELWTRFHALMLPSRSEGMPLVALEAVAAGRPVIGTNAGGIAEVVQDGATGFLGEANQRALDETMERAWNNRAHWPAMGLAACRHLASTLPAYPEQEFANKVMALL